ncbi:unnamed protein product [Caenorhabditis sp. 36 PRJEB53466]|nr:unnamed protein product [Caenorhabditis sp. 36 PRJEB53466]
MFSSSFRSSSFPSDPFVVIVHYGDCKAKEGADVCSDVSFCFKRAKIHRIGSNSVNEIRMDVIHQEMCFSPGGQQPECNERVPTATATPISATLPPPFSQYLVPVLF